jgi:hypothetical protein
MWKWSSRGSSFGATEKSIMPTPEFMEICVALRFRDLRPPAISSVNSW